MRLQSPDMVGVVSKCCFCNSETRDGDDELVVLDMIDPMSSNALGIYWCHWSCFDNRLYRESKLGP